MKLYTLTEYDLYHRQRQWEESKGHLVGPMSPYAHAFSILLAALAEVNKAGLDGKEITDLEIRENRQDGVPVIEIHGPVKHRLRQR